MSGSARDFAPDPSIRGAADFLQHFRNPWTGDTRVGAHPRRLGRRPSASSASRAIRKVAWCAPPSAAEVIVVVRAEIHEIEREWAAHLGASRYGQLRDMLHELTRWLGKLR